MEDYNRLVIDLYKRCFTDYINGSPVDADAIQEAQRGNEPTDTLEPLKKDVEYLKYDLL